MKTMDCTEARTQMLGAKRGRLGVEETEAFRAHLEGCDACAAADRADEALSVALSRLPKRVAPDALRAKLEARDEPEPAKATVYRLARWRRPLALLGAAAALALGVAAGT